MKRATAAEVTGGRIQQDVACVHLDGGHFGALWHDLWFCIGPLDAPNEIPTGSTVNRGIYARYVDFVYRDKEAS
jgi:hypothetical protein